MSGWCVYRAHVCEQSGALLSPKKNPWPSSQTDTVSFVKTGSTGGNQKGRNESRVWPFTWSDHLLSAAGEITEVSEETHYT